MAPSTEGDNMDIDRDHKVNHPDFRYAALAGAAPIVFIFERSIYNKPNAEQLAEYDRNEAIVEAHGGRMKKMRHEIAGETDFFTQADVDDMIAAVLRDNPDVELYSPLPHWNGVDCRTLSVGCIKAKMYNEA